MFKRKSCTCCLLILKNRTDPCRDRYEHSLFTAASSLVVRVRSVYAARWYIVEVSLTNNSVGIDIYEIK